MKHESFFTPPNQNWRPIQERPNVTLHNSFKPTIIYNAPEIPSVRITHYDATLSSTEKAPTYEIVEFVPTPEQPGEPPIVFMQGFMAKATDYEGGLAKLAHDTGKTVLAWNEIAGVKTGKVRYPISENGEAHEKDMFATQLSKVLAMKEILARMNVHDAEVFAHSEGAIHALFLQDMFYEESLRRTPNPNTVTDAGERAEIIQAQNHTLFKRIILLNPAGILEESQGGKIMAPSAKIIERGAQEKKVRDNNNGAFGTSEDFLPTGYADPRRNLLLALRSIMGIAGTNVTKLAVKHRNLGVDVQIFSGEIDQLFSMYAMEVAADKAGIPFIEIEEADHAGTLFGQGLEEIIKAFNQELEPDQVKTHG